MLPPMLVQETLMFCVITHSSKACLVWCRQTLKFYRFLFSCVEFPPFLKQIVAFLPLTSELFACSRYFKNWGNKILR
jgi:hypothetical protein